MGATQGHLSGRIGKPAGQVVWQMLGTYHTWLGRQPPTFQNCGCLSHPGIAAQLSYALGPAETWVVPTAAGSGFLTAPQTQVPFHRGFFWSEAPLLEVPGIEVPQFST